MISLLSSFPTERVAMFEFNTYFDTFLFLFELSNENSNFNFQFSHFLSFVEHL